ncbi:glycine receptor subunit alpha-4-like [Dendronephthya gigantea]|uniref:glycine receptor subunit alpha-4-like n=1 Tax=Dendronephthya gigantea TaxID=151771 RepID=UPI0010698E6D|nr:glycine receptor subunit alpha-4-like [Dendronephthya gigantea]
MYCVFFMLLGVVSARSIDNGTTTVSSKILEKIYPENNDQKTVSEKCDVRDDENHDRFWVARNITDLMSHLLEGYDRRIRPFFENREPMTVKVNTYITALGSFDELDMEFTTTMFFRQIWHDPRLAYGCHYKRDFVTMGAPILSQIWLPDTYFEYETKSQLQSKNFYLTLYRTGKLILSTRNTVLSSCSMHLISFPLDEQKCNFSIQSYGFSTRDVVYRWSSSEAKDSVKFPEDFSMSQFTLEGYRVFEKNSSYETGDYSGVIIELHLKRRFLYYIIQMYLPAVMVVMLSWVSFWVDSDSVPARVALGITTVLAMTTLMFGVQSALPKVPYMKAVDLFLAFSFICVFAALVEFAAVNYYVTNAQKTILQKKRERRKVLREKCKRNPKFQTIGQLVLGMHADDEDLVALGMNPGDLGGSVPASTYSGSPDASPYNEDRTAEQLLKEESFSGSYEKEIKLLMKKVSANAIDYHSRTIFPVCLHCSI